MDFIVVNDNLSSRKVNVDCGHIAMNVEIKGRFIHILGLITLTSLFEDGCYSRHPEKSMLTAAI